MSRFRGFAVVLAVALLVFGCQGTSHATPTLTPASPLAPGGPTGPTDQATVVEVTDGDTIRVEIDGHEYPLRYIGIDAPEESGPYTQAEALGQEAKQANERMVGGEEVVLEKDVSNTDEHDRLLRYVWLRDSGGGGWQMVNAELVREGLADAKRYPPDMKWQEILFAAESEAQAAGLGIWAP